MKKAGPPPLEGPPCLPEEVSRHHADLTTSTNHTPEKEITTMSLHTYVDVMLDDDMKVTTRLHERRHPLEEWVTLKIEGDAQQVVLHIHNPKQAQMLRDALSDVFPESTDDPHDDDGNRLTPAS